MKEIGVREIVGDRNTYKVKTDDVSLTCPTKRPSLLCCNYGRKIKMLSSIKVTTTPFEGQKPGTSGLRKAVKVFSQPHYTENFIQSLLTGGLGEALTGSTLVLGGDGRYFLHQAVEIIVRICAANKV